MAAPIIFPVALPGPSSISISPVEQRAMSSLEGSTRLRGRGFEVITKADLSWDFTQSQHDVFAAWYEIELGLGRRRFLMPLMSDGGTRVRLCQTLAGVKTTPLAGGVGWVVSMTIEYTEAVTISA